MIYSPYVWYWHRNTEEVDKAGAFIKKYGVQPAKHPDEYVCLGAWYDYQETPFWEDGKVWRMYYGKKQLVYDPSP